MEEGDVGGGDVMNIIKPAKKITKKRDQGDNNGGKKKEKKENSDTYRCGGCGVSLTGKVDVCTGCGAELSW